MGSTFGRFADSFLRMAAGAVLAFWGVALVLIAVPGADWAFTISAGLRGHSVLPAVGGLVAGYVVMTVIVAAGVGAVVAGSPRALTVVTLAGGAYLVWHGVTTLLRPPTPHLVETASGWGAFARGVGVSGLNPKGLLIFLALLPQFTDPRASWPVAGQLGVLGLTFALTCGAFYAALGTVARTLLQAHPGLASAVTRLSGAAMALIGATLLLSR